MKWPGDLIRGTLIKRYKRFLADVRLENGQKVTAHCANTGSMVTCLAENAPVWLTYHDDPKRKLKYSLQAIKMPDGWVGVNTGLSNRLVEEAFSLGIIPQFLEFQSIRAEPRIEKGTRLDFKLDGAQEAYVEVKNVTLLVEPDGVTFPDAISTRGQKHLQTLMTLMERGKECFLLFCVQRESAHHFFVEQKIDRAYCCLLKKAHQNGLNILVYKTEMDADGIQLKKELPLVFS